ncbi:GDSL-type esterase/lipase family protein [Mucilaginibacter myungsuensis]|uniref:SGNH hydrolase-type esterase domain-containing protein n=1 Tax=Mucilaginibacter myungsuensis TaxID=649104 RepID=A0A929PWY9_9SPHI|nr:GDSL-type esterase/lipase family protein [Mucilaginibacter myungsuensis]MBE9662601.1 hypothetical protein [Mucilaginibacter myungsuensis]MDN3598021.1 GDSL-type esterase/lipase family protein [Mucilaginibacter myungsuensis]
MKIKFLLVAALIFSTHAFAQTAKPKETYPFENEIKVYKAKDSVSMPKSGGILFIGSSSIRMWTDLPAKYPKKNIIMRGVGGSTIAQWVQYYMPSIVYPYQPSKIFIYVGDNDLASGASSASVYDNFVKLLGMIQTNVPKAKVYFMSMKMSPSRAKFYGEVTLGNERIRAYIKKQKDVEYLDVNTALFHAKAMPDSTYFRSDMLHLQPGGYDQWQAVLEPYIKK